jgi:hypothetical protein
MVHFLKNWVTGLVTAGAGVLLAPVLLPGLGKIARPMAKGFISLYLDVEEAVREGVDEHRRVLDRVTQEVAAQGLQEAAVAAMDREGEESVAEVVVEYVTEIIEVL